MKWYEVPGTPNPGIWWWGVQHKGHAAWFQRAVMAGDFGPGRLPLPRHVLTLDAVRLEENEKPRCGTCGEVPDSRDLEPVERSTGLGGWLRIYRAALKPWPKPTDPKRCWECCHRDLPVTDQVVIHKHHQFGRTKRQPTEDEAALTVGVCASCAAHLTRGGEKR